MYAGYNTTPIQAKLIKSATGDYYPLSGIQNFFKNFDWITVNVWWDDFDVFDGSITLCERVSSRCPNWSAVPNQVIGINGAAGQHIFYRYDFWCQEIALHINKNTATSGNVYWEVRARNQYGTEEIVSGIKALTDEINQLNINLTKILSK